MWILIYSGLQWTCQIWIWNWIKFTIDNVHEDQTEKKKNPPCELLDSLWKPDFLHYILTKEVLKPQFTDLEYLLQL